MSPEAQLETFISKYTEAVAARIRDARAIMRRKLPGAVELVYDNYNALAIAYSATEKQGGIVFSIAAYPRWVSLFFAEGAGLDDPTGRLKGEGARVRHIVLSELAILEADDVRALMDQALARASAMGLAAEGRLIIKSVSPRQRPRRPE